MDCSQLGAGYVVDEQWTNVDFTVDSCTATGASVTWKVTNQMVGTRVFVNGWSATDGAAATMTATVDTREDKDAPVASSGKPVASTTVYEATEKAAEAHVQAIIDANVGKRS